METLVATTLIVAIFVIASMILNNVFSSTLKRNTTAVEAQLSELMYLHQHQAIKLPYTTDFEQWKISFESIRIENKTQLRIEAVALDLEKIISIRYVPIH